MATACKQLTKDEHEIRTRMTHELFFNFHEECCRLNLDTYSVVVLLIHTVRQSKMADGTLKQGVITSLTSPSPFQRNPLIENLWKNQLVCLNAVTATHTDKKTTKALVHMRRVLNICVYTYLVHCRIDEGPANFFVLEILKVVL